MATVFSFMHDSRNVLTFTFYCYKRNYIRLHVLRNATFTVSNVFCLYKYSSLSFFYESSNILSYNFLN